MFITALEASDGRRWIAADLSRTDRSLDSVAEVASSLEGAGHSGDAALFLDEALVGAFNESLETLWQDMPENNSTLIVLLPRWSAPRVDPHYGEPATSFLCSPAVFSAFLALKIDCWAQSNLFVMLRAVTDGSIHLDRLLVRQLPETRHRASRQDGTPKALLMPHRGDPRHLRTALDYLFRTSGNSMSVGVGLDVEEVSEYSNFVNEYREVRFFQTRPAPVGPYVIRQELAERSDEPFICLQDSDDISCHDRFTVLSDALAETSCGIVGSHELCLDEIRTRVYPVRFPIDSSAALSICPNHALLHATLMARRSVFFECGGLSTDQIIANDTQFLLRAFFTTSIRNVDEFLYVRRRHAASLTNAPETVHDNPLRRSLNERWTSDFEAIKRGQLTIENSSLRAVKRTEPFRMTRIMAGEVGKA